MKRTILYICFTFFYHLVFSQQASIDSLAKALSDHPSEDTVRLNLLNKLADLYSTSHNEKAISTATEAITLAKKLENTQKIAQAYFDKGIIYSQQNQNAQAIEEFKTALGFCQQAKDSLIEGKVYYSLGVLYSNLSDYTKALENQNKALRIFELLHNNQRIAITLNSIGANYYYLSNYPLAINYYLKSLAVDEQMGEQMDIAIALRNIGLVNGKQNRYATAMAYYTRAMNIYKKLNDKNGEASILDNIGNIYSDQDNPKLALDYFMRALRINESIGDTKGVATDLGNSGIAYISLKNYLQAYNYLQKSFKIYKQLDEKRNMAEVLKYLGDIVAHAPASVLQQIGISPIQRFSKSLALKKQSLQIQEKIGDLSGQAEGLQGLSEMYSTQEDFKNAFQTYKKYIALKDSIFSTEKGEEITRLEMQYAFDKKEDSIKTAQAKQQILSTAEINRQRLIKNTAMGGSAVLLLAGISSFTFYKRKRDAVEQKHDAEFKAQVSDTEMKALRAQMNPHFIFNSLNSISDYISKNDIRAADLYLTKFARVMRMILESSEHKQVSLSDDLKALELYMQLESLRLNNNFSYEIKVDENIDTGNTLIPPLILQPFVENSIWHGFTKKEGPGKILIHIVKDHEMLNCVVEDNGVGRKNNMSEKNGVERKSLGMKITKARIEIINKIKKSNAAVTSSDLEEGMRVEVRLPLELSF